MDSDKSLILQQQIQQFIRLFGVLEQNKTPCGAPINITQAHALHELSSAGAITQQELANRLYIDKSTTSRLIDAFVKKGFVLRTTNPHNRRETLISITDQGRRANDQVEKRRRAKYQKILDGIPLDKQPEVLSALSHLIQSLKKEKENTMTEE
ncbi:MarR family transcriptional regulator [Brevibacillus humidisoli]|uniref:MarR family winged helix-turn-helix transcriptional regulator n=1 Tax=Brevibacillus humidisoli TaxID=2895522 RepID=UPI001E3A4262|nr:MarR family transcriptional regulator [Brevibacillus humidisoli]UFJ41128.1 MarR family transcriptional regulator [Brevibacillus humidisoli]